SPLAQRKGARGPCPGRPPVDKIGTLTEKPGTLAGKAGTLPVFFSGKMRGVSQVFPAKKCPRFSPWKILGQGKTQERKKYGKCPPFFEAIPYGTVCTIFVVVNRNLL
ncbi:MAG TPA: hypothetical protein PKW20_03720, partial [Syntrophales bacterium]|nr:hypothetical protein [Syntrophales bacterium]